jgi:hypothetical protein
MRDRSQVRDILESPIWHDRCIIYDQRQLTACTRLNCCGVFPTDLGAPPSNSDPSLFSPSNIAAHGPLFVLDRLRGGSLAPLMRSVAFFCPISRHSAGLPYLGPGRAIGAVVLGIDDKAARIFSQVAVG